MKNKIVTILSAILLVLMPSFRIQAYIVSEEDLPQLAEENFNKASMVFVGRSTSQQISEDNTLTVTTYRVLKNFKNTPGECVQISHQAQIPRTADAFPVMRMKVKTVENCQDQPSQYLTVALFYIFEDDGKGITYTYMPLNSDNDSQIYTYEQFVEAVNANERSKSTFAPFLAVLERKQKK